MDLESTRTLQGTLTADFTFYWAACASPVIKWYWFFLLHAIIAIAYLVFKKKQGLFHSFNPHSTMARSHTTRNHDFRESISLSSESNLSARSLSLSYVKLIGCFKCLTPQSVRSDRQGKLLRNILTKFKRSKITPSHNHATLSLHNT